MISRPAPIRVGDKFKAGETIWEVIRTLPGGKLELFDRVRTRFTDRYHRDVKTWERVPAVKCPTCGSTDVGPCKLYGGWWCDAGHNVPVPHKAAGGAS